MTTTTMKNQIKLISYICILSQIFVSTVTLFGTNGVNESNTSSLMRAVDARIVPSNLGCDNNMYCVKIEVRGQGGADYLGGSSIRFTYDPSVLCFDRSTEFNPATQQVEVVGSVGTYTSINFDDDQSTLNPGCNLFNVTPYDAHNFDGNETGEFLLTTYLSSTTLGSPPNETIFACPSIENIWTEVSEICFEVKNPTGNPNFQFLGNQNAPIDINTIGDTNFNDDSNDPVFKYWNGTLSGLNTPFDEVCNIDVTDCQLSIPMPYAGWHIISSYCKPLNDSIEAVFRPIVSDIIQVKNLTGQVYIPSFNNFNNGLDFWDIEAGYIVKTFNPVTLNIFGGQEVDLNVDDIPLYTGWNLIAYWLQGDSDPVDVFDNIANDVIQVKDLSGVYVPSFNDFNNMGNMSKTRGYLVKMNAANTLSYNAADILPKPTQGNIVDNIGENDRLKPTHFTKKIKPNPNTSTMLVLDDENNDLNYGDELGIFTKDGLLVGVFVYENDLMGGLIFGDDETEEGIDGILENEKYVFKVWNKILNKERSVEMEFVQGNSFYKKDDFCVVGFKVNSFTGINAFGNLSILVSPNPASSHVTFDLNLLKSENFTIEIYDVDGKLVEVIFKGQLTIGNSKIDYNVDHLSSGLYFYKISNKNEYFTERLTITH